MEFIKYNNVHHSKKGSPMLNFKRNIAFQTDSYKVSHWSQFPRGLEYSQYYVESRGGKFDEIMIAGVTLLGKILENGISNSEVDEANELYQLHFGSQVLHLDGWKTIANELGGKLPIRVRAVREGEVVPTKKPILVIENTDPRFGWLPGYLETLVLRAIWYQSTVATISFKTKQTINYFMQKTVADENIPGVQPFRLHDFGSRGVSSSESSAIGGLGHLYNFMGSDNVEALVAAKQLFGMNIQSFIAGHSIPAREHSTTTIYSEMGEDDAFLNSIQQWGGGLYACVMDSYDYEAAVERVTTGKFKDLIINSGGTFVVRPDSGNPIDVVMAALKIIAKKVGYTVNDKGYKVLHPSYRIIQGDGVDMEEILRILTWMESSGWSAENIAFGMGGGLLQHCDRDWGRWAMKMCGAVINGETREVFKAPKTDPSKASKKGFQDLIIKDGEYVEVSTLDWENRVHPDSVLVLVFENGVVYNTPTWSDILRRSNEQATVDLSE